MDNFKIMRRTEEIFNDLQEKAEIDYKIFQRHILSKSKEEIFESAKLIRDYNYLYELITEGKIKKAGYGPMKKLCVSYDCLKTLYDFWITEDLPGFEEDELFFIENSLKEL